jgi:thiol:disulfide interchange protein
MISMRFVRWCALLLLLLTCAPALRAQPSDTSSAKAPHLSVFLVVPPTTLAPGENFTAGIHFELERGWHVYWANAGDSGEPPRVRWTLPADVSADAFLFPTPRRLPLGPLMDFGYEDEVLFPVPMHVAPGAKPGSAPIAVKVDWLVCRESCIPGKASLSVERTIAAGSPVIDAHAQQMVDAALAQVPKPLPAGDKAVYQATAKGFALALTTGSREASAAYFPYDASVIANAAPEVVTPTSTGLQLALTKDDNLTAAPKELHGLVVLGDGRAYEVHAVPGAVAAVSEHAPLAGLLRNIGLALVGGIILNLMPCVFPVLFIKGLALVNSSREEQRERRLHGWVYTLGILASFWAVVAVLLVLRAAGHQLGWGFQFQSPIFLALMALFLFFLALSLAGMFEIGLSLTSAGGELAQKSGYAGSFFTGVLAMVVATPCTAPFMGAAIGYALAASALTSFAVFTALGLGLALPYLALAYNPSWTRLLPRPGAWMEVLKQAVAVPIFATVIWLVWVFTQTTGANPLAALLGGFLLLAVAGWILGRWPAKAGATWAAVLVILCAVAVPVFGLSAFDVGPVAVSAKSAANSAGSTDWQPFTPEIVAASRAAGHPVLVDFTASWCLSCQVNERVVLRRADVEQRLHAGNLVLVRADWTRHDEAISQTLAALGRSGIPVYALYPADPAAAPQLLPEVLTPGIIFSALDSLKH